MQPVVSGLASKTKRRSFKGEYRELGFLVPKDGGFFLQSGIFAHQGEHLGYRAGPYLPARQFSFLNTGFSQPLSAPKTGPEETSPGRGLGVGDREMTILPVTANKAHSVSGCLG